MEPLTPYELFGIEIGKGWIPILEPNEGERAFSQKRSQIARN